MRRKIRALELAVAVAVGSVVSFGALANNSPARSGSQPPVVIKATGATFSNIALLADQCGGVRGTLTITATGTVDDGGGIDHVYFYIYDDSAQKFFVDIPVPVGSTVATPVTVGYPGGVGTSAPGIGLYLYDDAGRSISLITLDPYFPTPVSGCATATVTAVPTTSVTGLGIMGGALAAMGFGSLYLRRRRTL